MTLKSKGFIQINDNPKTFISLDKIQVVRIDNTVFVQMVSGEWLNTNMTHEEFNKLF